MVAAQAAIAISQVLAYERVQALAQREQTLNRITATIRSSLEPEVMFAAIARELGQALEVDGCTLSLWTKDDKFVRCVGLYNPQESVPIGSNERSQATSSAVPIAENPILQALLYTKKPVKSDDLQRQKKLARYELPWHSKARALLIVPLIVDGEIIGSITLRQSQNSRKWHDCDLELAEMVAAQAAIAVQQSKLYETTKQQAEQLQIKEREVSKLNDYLTESVLKRFLPEAIVNKAAKGELLLDLNPEPRRITVLFCDLVGFTNLSGQLGSRLLAEILNEYLEAMSKAVFDRGGTVDKFIGDAIMAMFGAPEELSRHEQAKRAIATAQTMHSYLQQLNQKWQNKGLTLNTPIPPLQMRCGIHQGRAIVGMFGGGQRKDYTAIGQVVNIAARLQGVATPNQILISETVANCLEDLQIEHIQSHKLKGIERDFATLAISLDIEQ
jgi:adenylate cyclase